VSIRDQILERLNKGRKGAPSPSYHVHLLRTVEDQLERMPSDTLWKVEKQLEVLAQMTWEDSSADPVREKLRDARSGLFRFEAHEFSVFFEVDSRNHTLLVSRIAKGSSTRSGVAEGPQAASPADTSKPLHPREERHEVHWRVQLRCADWRYAARVVALNASRAGVFIATSKPPEVGSTVELTLQLPDGSDLKVSGTVQHIVSPERALGMKCSPGVGVRIDPRHQLDLSLLEQMALQEIARVPIAPAAGPAAQSALKVGGRARPSSTPATSTTRGHPKPASPAARAVGIDFGTTYSSVSVAFGDYVQLIPDEQGRSFQPTLVGFPEGRPPVIGWPAREILSSDPRRAISSVKRLLGHKFSDPKVAGYLHSTSYKTQRGINDSILVVVDDKTFPVGDICTMVLAHLRDVASKYLGTPVGEAVMTVPVTFTEHARDVLRRAAAAARLEVIEFVEEPVAGALAYGVGKGKNEIVAVYDFGGGTFDFSVLDVVNDHFHVLGAGGDPWLGGDDFDDALAQNVADAVWRATNIELRQRVVEWQRLLIACEGVKRQLTTETVARLEVPGLLETPQRLDISQTIERSSFESLSAELLERSLGVCSEVLEKLGLEPRDMTEVVVTGGISRIPMIRAGASRFFEREIVALAHPDEAVVLGAGLRAAQKVDHPVRGVVDAQSK